jgi:hypothetical protein
MDTIGFLFLFVSILIVLLIFFSVRKAIKAAQKRKLEEQEREKEEKKIEELKGVGLHIPTTVRYSDEHALRTEGRHPDTNKPLFFMETRKTKHIVYERGDLVHVLVDLKNPTNYIIEWPPAPDQRQVRLSSLDTAQDRNRHQRYARQGITWDDDHPPFYNARQRMNHQLLDDGFRPTRKNRRRHEHLKMQKCFFCGGEGITGCATCEGTGCIRIPSSKRGKANPLRETCFICKGSGELRCPHCNGGGFFIDFS